MGKKLIIKGADFSANGIPTIATELIYDSITGKSVSGVWASSNAAAISVPPAARIEGRTLTSIVIKKGSDNATQDIGISKYNMSSGMFTLLTLVPKDTFNANELTTVNLGGVVLNTSELLMVGSTSANLGSFNTRFTVTAGDESLQLGRYTLLTSGVLNDVVYTTALMCKIYAVVE